MKTALVTGASRGFGRILSEELARQGFLTYAAMRETAGHNKPVADELESIAKRNTGSVKSKASENIGLVMFWCRNRSSVYR